MKYKLTDETKWQCGHTLHRIECVTAFATVKAGEIGGWVESEDNLSQGSNAWVYGDAMVYDNAWIHGDAEVYGNAAVCGNAIVYEDAMVYDNAWVYGDAKVYGNVAVYGNAAVCDDAMVYGNAEVYGNARICGNAVVCKTSDYIVLKNCWGSGRYFTYTASNDKWRAGCFHGTGEELVKKAYSEGKLKGKCYEASVKYVQEIMRLVKEYK